jgi:RecT family protein
MTDTQQLVSRVDAPLERRRVGDMQVDSFAGLKFQEYREAIEFSKLMAQARNSVPAYLKENPGDCLAIVTQALRWHLEPYWVAQHSYVARDESLIAYDAAVHAAIVLSSGLLSERPRYEFSGEGEELTCTVTATFKGETSPLSYTTPPLKKCRPARNERGQVRGSPLWERDPPQQLGYYAIRNWGRRHCPEVLGGVYDREEFEHATQNPAEQVIPPSPNLMERLPGKIGETGFSPDVFDTALAKKVVAKEAPAGRPANRTEAARDEPIPAEATTPAPDTKVNPDPPQARESPKEPASEGEYMAYAARWIENTPDPDDIEARWDGERDMRAKVKLSVGVRKRLEGMMKTRTAELRKDT